MDEAVAGHATFIEVSLEADNFLSIRDNGRGVPVDAHPKFKHLSALEVILTTLHSGGKFGGKVYDTSGGLHGVGASVVNALSELLEVEVARDRVLWKQRYVRGKPAGKLANAGPVNNRRGTTIRSARPADFRRDPVQPGAALPAVPVQGLPVPRCRDPLDLRSRALVGAKDDTPAEATLHFPGGLSDSLEEDIGAASPVIPLGPARLIFLASARAGSNGRLLGWRRGRASCPIRMQYCSHRAGR